MKNTNTSEKQPIFSRRNRAILFYSIVPIIILYMFVQMKNTVVDFNENKTEVYKSVPMNKMLKDKE